MLFHVAYPLWISYCPMREQQYITVSCLGCYDVV